MDTEMKPVFADYRYNVTEEGVTHYIISTEGSFSAELVRKILNVYGALTPADKDRVDTLIWYANETGTPINE